MSISILILGDICPRWGNSNAFTSGLPEIVFNDIYPLLMDADYVVGNLEAPITTSTQKLYKNSVNLKAEPCDAVILKKCGIDALALANNHILDYSSQGLIDTCSILSDNQISFYGAGSIEDAAKPHIVVINNIRIGFMAFSEREFNCAVDYGVGSNLWDDFDSIKAIRNAKRDCDYLFIQYHGGIEHYEYPSPNLQKKCRAMAEAGANFVTCQHSHCIGTMERWNGCEILYGQGNTFFGYSERRGDKWNIGLICRLDINKLQEDIKATFIPVVATKDGERLADPQVACNTIKQLLEKSESIGNEDFVDSNWNAFCMNQSSEYLPMFFGWNNNLARINRLFRGKLTDIFVSKKSRRDSMNLLRCDSHREVVSTILTQEFFRNKQRDLQWKSR